MAGGLLGLIGVPAAALLLVHPSTDTLTRLSDVGQAYGVLSAMLSALALGAVAASVFLQQRQRAEGILIEWRRAHGDLLQLQMSEPEVFGLCTSGSLPHMSRDEYRQYLFTTLFLNYLRTNVGIHGLNAATRAEALGEMFDSEVARRLWRIRRRRIQVQLGGMDAFFAVVDEEYEKAVAAGPAGTFGLITDLEDDVAVARDTDRPGPPLSTAAKHEPDCDG